MKVIYELYFQDLTEEKQEEIINDIKEILKESNKEEGEKYLQLAWHEPKPLTWQEAYIRSYAIDHIMWDMYESGEDKELPNFIEIYDEYLEEKARKVAVNEIRHIGAEVEVA